MILSRRRYVSGGGFTFGNALDFDGVDDNVTFTQYGSIENTWSFSTWINSPNVSTDNQGLITDSITNNYARIQNAFNRIILRINSTNYFFTGFNFLDNTWYHIAISNDAGSCRCWVNGTESTAGALAIPASTPATNNFNQLGRDNGGNELDGKMDETALWYTYALTPANVAALYNGGAGEDATTIDTPYFAYHFDESGTDTTAVDSSSTNDGTLNNFPASGMWVAH